MALPHNPRSVILEINSGLNSLFLLLQDTVELFIFGGKLCSVIRILQNWGMTTQV